MNNTKITSCAKLNFYLPFFLFFFQTSATFLHASAPSSRQIHFLYLHIPNLSFFYISLQACTLCYLRIPSIIANYIYLSYHSLQLWYICTTPFFTLVRSTFCLHFFLFPFQIRFLRAVNHFPDTKLLYSSLTRFFFLLLAWNSIFSLFFTFPWVLGYLHTHVHLALHIHYGQTFRFMPLQRRPYQFKLFSLSLAAFLLVMTALPLAFPSKLTTTHVSLSSHT